MLTVIVSINDKVFSCQAFDYCGDTKHTEHHIGGVKECLSMTSRHRTGSFVVAS